MVFNLFNIIINYFVFLKLKLILFNDLVVIVFDSINH